MTQPLQGNAPSRPSILWVGKAPVNDGGDEIYDRKILAALETRFAVTRFDVVAQSRPHQIRALLRGLPVPRYQYSSPSLEQAFRAAAAQHDHVVVSLELFDHLAGIAARPVTLIVHNVRSDVMAQLYGRHPIGRLAAAQSLRWERKLYPRPDIALVALSQRDRALIETLASGRPVGLACPGTPPLTPLDSARVIPDLVLSGSYDWRAKRHDLIALAKDVASSGETLAWRHDLPLPDAPHVAAIKDHARPIDNADYAQGLRFGVIPDRFLGGFKLKSTYFIANNCVVLSRCDMRMEFDGLPFADRFVRFTPKIADMTRVIAEIGAIEPDTLRAQWLAFQAGCAERFSWRQSADVIAATFS